jgi:aspartyl-tRNA(Asn)/glutamyl-tRNA(Gln) amidotransferase subunit B
MSATAANPMTDVMHDYEPVIGLEVHVQLLTASKAFCGCSVRFGDAPNTNVCPVCLGLPGALPVMNRKALDLAMRAALALNINVNPTSRFARKNYFYPDLPKGYQISQSDMPLALGGWLEIDMGGVLKRIGITRLHMEEDAGKSMHEGFADSATRSYIDLNRCGTALVEIVSEPDMRSPAEAYAYLTAIKQVLLYTEVSDCNMEEGSLRCDANVSVRRRGTEKFGAKVEVKNLNSFRYLQKALEYEIQRQVAALESGGKISQETRLWNVSSGKTEQMRSKEFAHDYRYFPEPDLAPVHVTAQMIANVRSAMPELPAAKRARFTAKYGLSAYDAGVLSDSRALADYFEATVMAGATAKTAANWIAVELLRRLNDAGKEIGSSPVTPNALAALLKEVESGKITAASGKKVFARIFDTGREPAQIIAEEGHSALVDSAEIERVCREVIEMNPGNLAKYRAGNEGMFKFFVGQAMRATRGQADPKLINDTLRRLLGS